MDQQKIQKVALQKHGLFADSLAPTWSDSVLGQIPTDLYSLINSHCQACRAIDGKPSLKANHTYTFSHEFKLTEPLSHPFGVAIHKSGEVFISDCHNHQIQVFSSDGTFLRSFGNRGKRDGCFEYPVGIAFTRNGNLVVVCNGNNRVQILKPDGTFIIQWGGYGEKNGQFFSPYGVAVHHADNNIIVADTGHHRIQIFNSQGKWLRTLGERGSKLGELLEPIGIAVTLSGNLLVADRDNLRLQLFDYHGKEETQIFQESSTAPIGLAIDRSGQTVVVGHPNANESPIQILSPTGELLSQHGEEEAKNRHIVLGKSVAIDAAGNLIIVDYQRDQVLVYK